MAQTLDQYQALLKSGKLREDPAQREAAELLGRLEDRLRTEKRRSLPWQPPREAGGIYLYGGVGAGKTLLMDLFADHAPDLPTRRVHYHVFMEEMHSFIAGWRDMGESERRRHPARARRSSLDDPIPHAAKQAFQQAELLCLDEMQVTDIADAMLLGRLFEQYFTRGGTLVVTSNRHPTDLYKDGINRELFLPFISIIQETLEVHELAAAEDYRLSGLQKHGLYFSPLGHEADTAMDRAFEAQLMGKDAVPDSLTVHGRTIPLDRTAGDVARASFSELCERPLGAGEYLTLSRRFATVFLDRIPLLSPENADAASRFRTLIDALYDHRCKLVCSADAEPDQLYASGKLAFEFERTASRLFEMRSEDYLTQSHRTDED
ncbi:cell division protein ZapE [Parvularcula sp. ZS-1/3]|uniref:Cell division protein ZapE n=1 Tax=Parvularcula mediterranea TaxID=2732508 RepID=A0A7Y3W4L5_9PROT|nr:cell division protein ZapE [Parvularcula mediterranea]NNU15639.1 cell division protein ZapE [Parvularcula mediterranea]